MGGGSRAAAGDGRRFYGSLVERCVEDMLSDLGSEDIEAVLMIGAPSRREPTVIATPDGPYSLSDVDLVCLCRRGADVAAMRPRLASWVSKANVRFADACTGVDASLRPPGPDEEIPPLIATFEMLRSPAVVWGDEGVLDELPRIAIEDVPSWDSLVLFHNRVVEQVLLPRRLSEPSIGFREAASLLYTSGKFLLDSVTALLFLDHNVPATYTERMRAFGEEYLVKPGREQLRKMLEPCLPELRTWAAFKASGDLPALRALCAAGGSGTAASPPAARRAGSDPGAKRADGDPDTGARAGEWTAEGLVGTARACVARYSSCANALWREVLGRVTGVDAMDLSLDGLVALYGTLEPQGRKLARFMKALRSPAAEAGLYSPREIMRLATFASPRQLSYLMAVLAYAAPGDKRHEGAISESMVAYCPFRVPRGFRGMALPEKRALLAERLDVFHKIVLKGRVAKGAG